MIYLFTVFVCLFSFGCTGFKGAGKTLGSMVEIRGELIKKFGENDINVNYRSMPGSSVIQVTYVNSPLNQKGGEERWTRAQETAVIVKDHYPEIKSVSQILVAFMKAETKFLVVTTTVGIDYFVFDNEGKEISSRGEGSSVDDTDSPIPVYAESTNETNITASFQLAGVPGQGLTMVSSLKVVGDTKKETPRAPKTASFDFASFSKQVRFPGETLIRFEGDGKVIFEDKQKFSQGPGTDGVINQFAYVTMPFSKFRQVSECKKVKVALGDYSFDLTEKQIGALSKMTQYVK